MSVCACIHIYAHTKFFSCQDWNKKSESEWKHGLVLMVSVGAGQRKEWVILKDSGKISSETCLDWVMRKWIEAHKVGGWEGNPMGVM